jgi:hypothetical protein
LGIGLAIATGLAANLGSSLQVQAQDLNLQTQLNILSPPPLAETPPATDVATPPPNSPLKPAWLSGKCTTPVGTSLEQQKRLDKILSEEPKITIREYQELRIQELRIQEIQNQELQKPRFRIKLAPPPPDLTCGNGQPVKIKVSFPLNPTYETDVLKTGNNSSHGESFGIGSNVLVTGPGLNGRPFDLVALSAAEASSRYAQFFSQNVDTINTYLAYQAFLHADGYYFDEKTNKKTFIDNIDQTTSKVPAGNMTTIDTLAFGIQNQTAYTPTFHQEKADFLTPQVTLSRLNIGLDDPNAKPCIAASTNPPPHPPQPPQPQFCYYANLSLTVGQSFSDVRTQQNTNAAVSATLGWRPDRAEWNLALQAMATAKDYEDFVGGRRDLLLQAGPVFTYAPATKFKITPAEYATVLFTLPVTYYKNYSTFSAAAWSGLIVMPTLTIAFNYTAM